MPTAQSPLRTLAGAWWPLAGGWLLLGIELPLIGMVLARLEHPTLTLACFGGVIYPLGLLLESPVFMLLGASSALCKDEPSFLALRQFTNRLGAGLTAAHMLLALTPLYGLVVEGLLGASPELSAASRAGVVATLPWAWAVAYRRLLQGGLIRFGFSRTVGHGTTLRMAAVAATLAAGWFMQWPSGAVLGPSALSIGMLVEAVFAHRRFHALIPQQMRSRAAGPELTQREIFRYYLPLALTSMLHILVFPIGTAAMLRMGQPLASLAAWPVVSGLLFVSRTPGVAMHEVIVSYAERPGFARPLFRFTLLVLSVSTAVLLLVALSPAAPWWFGTATGLTPELTALACTGLLFGLPLTPIYGYMSWPQGLLLHGRQTRRVSEATFVYLVLHGALLYAGVSWNAENGLCYYLLSSCVAAAAQGAWMWWFSRPIAARLLVG